MANARNSRLANAGAQRFAANAGLRRGNAFASERFGGHGWRDHDRGFRRFWAGGVFWPYFIGDYVSFAFWPYDYYDAFWGYGPDALLWSAFWPGYDYPYWSDGYGAAYAGDIYGRYREAQGRTRRPAQRAASISPQEVAASCAGFAPGVNDLPLERITPAIQPTPDQQAALDDWKSAMAKASDILSGACPQQVAATPAARLDAMEQRLRAMQQAEDAIREPLLRLYGLLGEDQKQRLNEAVEASQQSGQRGSVDLAKLCSSQAGFTNVPEDEIVKTIALDDRQMQDLDNLKQASARAAEILRNACPANVPETLSARLDAAEKRLSALIEAIDTVRPRVETFFASLSDDQKTALKSQAPGVRSASARRR
jgi:hypothetical protein